MLNFFLIFSRHGKIRLKRWFHPASQTEKTKHTNEVVTLVLARKPSMCNVIEWKEQKLIYRRYASLFFCACIDFDGNELITLEMIHRYVQVLDEYFGNVCELDIVYGMQDAYMILDELLINGEFQESSRKAVTFIIRKMDQTEKLESMNPNASSSSVMSSGGYS